MHFNKLAKPSQEDPVLLVCDNHSSHISLEMYEFCKSQNIHVVSLPPHTSHKIQPLDVSFYGPLKNAYYRECDLHLKITAHEKLTMYELAALFNKAYVKVATMEKSVSGFLSTGIYPLNVDKFTEDDFAPAREFLTVDVEQDPVASTSIQEEPVASTSLQEEPVASTSIREEPVASTSLQADLVELDNSEIQNVSVVNSSSLSIEDIAPIPKKRICKTSKRNKKQHSQILTATPFKMKLINEKEKRDLRVKKAAAKKTIKLKEKEARKQKKSKATDRGR